MSVSVKFEFKGAEQEPIVCHSEGTDINSISAEAKESNTSYEYSGRHDHGTLPQLKSDGHMAQLVGSLQDAKREGDAVLTALIEKEKDLGQPSEKKRRTNEEEEEKEG